MRAINMFVVHCSATKKTANVGVKEIREWHKAQGWSDIGYHFVIRRDGTIENGRPLEIAGAHTKGYNANSIGICMVGGLADDGKKGEDNFDPKQYASLKKKLAELYVKWPKASLRGHRDLSPDKNHDGIITKDEWIKDCPSFDVRKWWATNK